VANQQLRGKDALEQAQVIQWMDFADGAILPVSCKLTFPLIGIMPLNKQVRVTCIL
jgi:glutathione S-transferase